MLYSPATACPNGWATAGTLTQSLATLTTFVACYPSYVPALYQIWPLCYQLFLGFDTPVRAEGNVPSCVSDINSLSSSYVEIQCQPSTTSLISTMTATDDGFRGLGDVWVMQIWIIKSTFGDYHIIPFDAGSSTTFTSSASLVTRSQLTDVSETAIATTTAASVADQKSNSLSTGAIVGISFGAVIVMFLAISVAAVLFLVRSKQREHPGSSAFRWSSLPELITGRGEKGPSSRDMSMAHPNDSTVPPAREVH
jgi:hypothetical protein